MSGVVGACASKKTLDVITDKPTEEVTPPPVVDDGTINGTKILDGNNVHGLIKDSDGAPVKGVPVTDGYTYVKTDKNGVYQFKADSKATFVYYSLPSGYAIEQTEANSLPSFYRKINPGDKNRNDFTLVKIASSSSFSFAVLGDIHVRDTATSTKFRNGAMKQIGEYFKANPSVGPVFGVSLGDIINNAKDPDTYAMARGALRSAEYASGKYVPFYTVIGNHDHNARKGDKSQSGTEGFDKGTETDYANTFGPTCYSFNIGRAHFVAIDNYISKAEPNSSSTALSGQGATGLSEDVYKWIVKDLELVDNKAVKMVVVLQHCHVRGFADVPHREDLLDKLSAFNTAYIFSGHAHICETYKYKVTAQSGKPIIERIHGVPMGNFWYSRYNPDGAPAGFYIYNVNGSDFSSWEYRPVHDPSDQMRVYDTNDVYDKTSDWSHQYAWKNNALFAEGNFLIAHIYNGDEDWEVSLEHEGKMKKMTFANQRISDYCVNCHLANDNIEGIRTSWKYHWDNSENWWYIKLDKPASELTGWRVVAKAKFPGSSETIMYTCDKITKKLDEK